MSQLVFPSAPFDIFLMLPKLLNFPAAFPRLHRQLLDNHFVRSPALPRRLSTGTPPTAVQGRTVSRWSVRTLKRPLPGLHVYLPPFSTIKCFQNVYFWTINSSLYVFARKYLLCLLSRAFPYPKPCNSSDKRQGSGKRSRNMSDRPVSRLIAE